MDTIATPAVRRLHSVDDSALQQLGELLTECEPAKSARPPTRYGRLAI